MSPKKKKLYFCALKSTYLSTIKNPYNMQLLVIGTTEIILIVLLVLLLFGGRKIPELMRGLGKGVKSFKDGVNGVEEPEIKADKEKENKE